jgi:hypothetical protein
MGVVTRPINTQNKGQTMQKVMLGNCHGLIELSAESREKFYLARILPDGRIWYFVNLVPVDTLPSTPLCNDVRAAIDKVYDMVQALYRLPHGSEFNAQYWNIHDALHGV